MDSTNIPIVRLTLETMQHSILMAFSDHAAKMDADVQAAVKAMCTPENVARMISEQTNRAIEAAINEQIRSYYAYGNGARVIKDAVVAHLDKKHAQEG